MSAPYKEATVGLIVVLAVGIFLAGALWLRGKSWGGADVYVAYRDVGTLKDASSVRISGAQVGRVDGIHYVAPGKVVIGIKFNGGEKLRVTSGATASIEAVGMLGDMMVVFDPGTGRPLVRGDTIEGTMAAGLFDKASKMADVAIQTMDRLNRMLDTTVIVDLHHTLTSAQRFMDYVSDSTRGPTAQINPTLVSLQRATNRLDSSLAGFNAGAIQARLDTTMHAASDASAQLAALSRRADSLMTSVQEGRGSVGRLMNDTTLYVSLRATLQSLTDLINDIKKNPGKIGVTVRVP